MKRSMMRMCPELKIIIHLILCIWVPMKKREREMCYTWQMVVHTCWRSVLPDQYCILVRCGDFVSAKIICHIKSILRIWWKFPGNPVVRTLTFHLRGHRPNPGSGNPTSCDLPPAKKKKKKIRGFLVIYTYTFKFYYNCYPSGYAMGFPPSFLFILWWRKFKEALESPWNYSCFKRILFSVHV